MSTAEPIVSRNPTAPDEIVASIAAVGPAEISALIERATQVQPGWARRTMDRSAALDAWSRALEDDREALARLVAREIGKPIREARAEVSRAAAILRYYAQAALDPVAEVFPSASGQGEVRVERHARGVVAVVCPWNFPLAIPVWKIAPALAYGNAVLMKPSSAAIGVALRLVELARPSVPEEVLAVVSSRGDDAMTMLDDPRVAAVSFTGSSEVGRRVVARVAARGAAVQSEMGGQNASIVLPDADLERAAASIVDAAMGYAGQKCTATRRVIVLDAIAEELVDRLVARTEELRVGDPLEEETAVGPVIDERALNLVERAVDGAVGRGARVLTGGRRRGRAGWFYAPTLLAIDDAADEFACVETFGPVAAILTVRSVEEAITIANGTEYGLVGAIFSQDLTAATTIANALHVGMVKLNAPTTGADYWVPFGGDRASSYGPREQGRAARDFYDTTRTVTITP